MSCETHATVQAVASAAHAREAPVGVRTVSTPEAFAALAPQWDGLVRAMPRPSPFLLHGWLREWWRHHGERAEVTVHVAERDGRLAGALPLAIVSRHGVRRLQFMGGEHASLGDVLLAPGEPDALAAALATPARASRHDAVDLSGLPAGSHLATVLGADRLRLIPRAEAPVLDMGAGWEAVYQAKMPSSRRRVHRRRERRLAEAGRLEVELARTPAELEPALADAIRLHRLRWHGRPDGSVLATERGERFFRAGMLALAAGDVARVLVLRLDGTAIAFQAYFALEGRMVLFRTGFAPEYAAQAPGHLALRHALAAGSAEGLERVEFLGGDEPHKRELADRNEPLYQAIGAPRTLRGRAFVRGRVTLIGARRQLRRNETLRRLYLDGLAPVRRALKR